MWALWHKVTEKLKAAAAQRHTNLEGATLGDPKTFVFKQRMGGSHMDVSEN